MTEAEARAIVIELARAYTRGVGFSETGDPFADVDAVVTAASKRFAANPEQVAKTDTIGPFARSLGAGFQGWSLAELAVLNRYRKRAQ